MAVDPSAEDHCACFGKSSATAEFFVSDDEDDVFTEDHFSLQIPALIRTTLLPRWDGASELKRVISRDGVSDDASTVTPDSELAFDDEEQDLLIHRSLCHCLSRGVTASGSSVAAVPATTMPSYAAENEKLATAARIAQLHRNQMDLKESMESNRSLSAHLSDEMVEQKGQRRRDDVALTKRQGLVEINQLHWSVPARKRVFPSALMTRDPMLPTQQPQNISHDDDSEQIISQV